MLLLTTAANLLAVLIMLPAIMAKAGGGLLVVCATTLTLYIGLVVPAAFTRKRWLFAALIGLHVFIYVVLGALSAAIPDPAAASPVEPPAATAPPSAP